MKLSEKSQNRICIPIFAKVDYRDNQSLLEPFE